MSLLVQTVTAMAGSARTKAPLVGYQKTQELKKLQPAILGPDMKHSFVKSDIVESSMGK